jgi:hypothetical protein
MAAGGNGVFEVYRLSEAGFEVAERSTNAIPPRIPER